MRRTPDWARLRTVGAVTKVGTGRNDLWGGLLLVLGFFLALTAFTGVRLFQVALTVFFLWLALARDKGWAWIPAAIFGFNVAKDLLDGIGGSIFFPLVVIGAGVLLLSRGRMSNQATIGILVLLAVIGIAARNGGVEPETTKGEVESSTSSEPAPDRMELPELKGRQLLVVANNADVAISRSPDRRFTAGEEAGEFEISELEGIVQLDLSDLGTGLDLEVPSEARVVVRTNSGEVEARIDGFGLEVDTVSGDVDVELAGNYRVEAETLSGEIEIDGFEDLDEDAKKLRSTGSGPPVQIKTVSGTISVEKD